LSGLVDAAVQAAEYGTEEARSVISAILKSIAMYIQQIAAWLQSFALGGFKAIYLQGWLIQNNSHNFYRYSITARKKLSN